MIRKDAKPMLCKMLGVDVDEKFTITGDNPTSVYVITANGEMRIASSGDYRLAPAKTICLVMNNPSLVDIGVPTVEFTEHELEICRILGAKYVSLDVKGAVCLWETKPYRRNKDSYGAGSSLYSRQARKCAEIFPIGDEFSRLEYGNLYRVA